MEQTRNTVRNRIARTLESDEKGHELEAAIREKTAGRQEYIVAAKELVAALKRSKKLCKAVVAGSFDVDILLAAPAKPVASTGSKQMSPSSMTESVMSDTNSTGSTRFDRYVQQANQQMGERRGVLAFKATCEAADANQQGTGLLPLHALPRLLQDAGVQLTPGTVDEIRSRFTEKGRFAWRNVVRWLAVTPGSLVPPPIETHYASAKRPPSTPAAVHSPLTKRLPKTRSAPLKSSQSMGALTPSEARPPSRTLADVVAPPTGRPPLRLPTPKSSAHSGSQGSLPPPPPKSAQPPPTPLPPLPPVKALATATAKAAAAPAAASPKPSPKPELTKYASRLRQQFRDEVEMHYNNLAAAFRSLDVDGDGKLTSADLRRGLSKWGIVGDTDKVKELEQIFGSADADGSGAVDYAEFANALVNNSKQTKTIFGANDAERGMSGHVVGNITGGFAGGQVFLNENIESNGGRHGVVHRDSELFALPHTSKAATAEELEEEKKILREHIATKYKLFQNAFRHFDRDASGAVDVKELEAGVQFFNLPIPAEHVRQIAADMDRGDGKIDYAAFADQLHERDQQVVDMFKWEGTDNSDKVRYGKGGFAKKGT